MDASAREALEVEVRKLCDRGQYQEAATAALKGFGPEVYGLLCALYRDEQQAEEVFSAFSENLWKGLPTFAWQSSLRTWAYTLARHTSHRHLRDGRHRRKDVAASSSSIAEQLAQQVRTRTRTFLRTETKDRFAEIRRSLPPDDQLLLVLRVDRDMAWNDLARVMLEDESADAAEITRRAALLRKRFQLLKEKLIKLAKEAGLTQSREE